MDSEKTVTKGRGDTSIPPLLLSSCPGPSGAILRHYPRSGKSRAAQEGEGDSATQSI